MQVSSEERSAASDRPAGKQAVAAASLKEAPMQERAAAPSKEAAPSADKEALSEAAQEENSAPALNKRGSISRKGA